MFPIPHHQASYHDTDALKLQAPLYHFEHMHPRSVLINIPQSKELQKKQLQKRNMNIIVIVIKSSNGRIDMPFLLLIHIYSVRINVAL